MRRILTCAFVLGLCGLGATAQAQTATGKGFQINRYEPTAAGEWSFWVDHPWYSSMRYFAAGVTLDYGHNPLVYGVRDSNGSFSYQQSIIEHQLIGHVDIAGSFLDRVQIAASLPVVFLERGNEANGVKPLEGVAVGDPRIGAKVRLFGQPYRSAISMSLGIDFWIPINSFSDPPPFPSQTGESGLRVLPKIMLGGLAKSVMWSFTAGFLYRPEQTIGNLPVDSGNTMASEIQLGAAIKYANYEKRFAIGPEALLSTVVMPGENTQRAFRQDFTSLELLLGIHYNIARVLQLGVAGGVGLLREPGTPDGRALFRIAYAPIREDKPKDRDGDGVNDKEDACIDEPGVRTLDKETNGCPPPPADRDHDGVVDPQDQCPDEAQGQNPDPEKRGCPLRDKDGDGVWDRDDKCVDEPQGQNPDPEQKGCPLRDKDGDGVWDREDQCVDVPAGAHPDPNKKGCPDIDTDNDGVYDGFDQCKDVPQGMFPDPQKVGCPLPDRDHDSVPDPTDACPDKPGAPSADPKKNGCPGLVEMKGSQIVILQQVFFATNKDTILKKSFPVLNAVADVMNSMKQIKKVDIEGHTDDKGKADLNTALSERRAKSVMAYLVSKGVGAERLDAHGYGPSRPIADNKTNKGRALNRRVDFKIVDPPQAEPTKGVVNVVTTPVALPPAEPEKGAKGKKAKEPKGKKGAAAVTAPGPAAATAPAAASAEAAPKEKKSKKEKKAKK